MQPPDAGAACSIRSSAGGSASADVSLVFARLSRSTRRATRRGRGRGSRSRLRSRSAVRTARCARLRSGHGGAALDAARRRGRPSRRSIRRAEHAEELAILGDARFALEEHAKKSPGSPSRTMSVPAATRARLADRTTSQSSGSAKRLKKASARSAANLSHRRSLRAARGQARCAARRPGRRRTRRRCGSAPSRLFAWRGARCGRAPPARRAGATKAAPARAV